MGIRGCKTKTSASTKEIGKRRHDRRIVDFMFSVDKER